MILIQFLIHALEEVERIRFMYILPHVASEKVRPNRVQRLEFFF